MISNNTIINNNFLISLILDWFAIMNNDYKIKEFTSKYGYSEYMIKRYFDFLGIEQTESLLKSNEIKSKQSIRVNTLKIKPEILRSRLEKLGLILKDNEWISYAFDIHKEHSNLGSLHEYLQGYFYIQNKVSMLPPYILQPSSNDTVIDMCASPGGKSTHLAQIMKNKGKLLLIERNKKRIPALEFNIRRMGIYNSVIINEDARNIPNSKLKGDKILLDAPCTGEGLIRDDPTRKKNRTVSDIKKMAKIQEELLLAGLKILKKEGLLIYSTCSISPEENEMVIDRVLKKQNNFEIVKIQKQYGISGFTKVFGKELDNQLQFSQRFFPHIHDTIGFFICLIKKIHT
ncbi:MAG: RsmB/NOP family class I SAM-dependent RNA methyltransferase [Candidatus Lokiarchaeota archaeon]|nr:RsmB/NOP family class I SAM-dependent RNA methyltransferase [Candidatus Lokiarchaeota archaeon]